jgi:hypothetical protein
MIQNARTEQTNPALVKSEAIVQLHRNGKPTRVTVRGHDCFGRPLILRVDESKALLLGEKGYRNVEPAIRRMTSGTKAVLSYWAEPCEEAQTLELDLSGLAETLTQATQLSEEELQGLVAQIIAEREAAERTEAENRLKKNPSAELLLAARNGNIVRVIASLNLEADVDTQSESNGYTPLTWASSRGHTEVVRLLLEAGADVNVTANDGQTALMRAADYGHVEVLQLLLAAGADVNVKSVNGITALRFATLKGNNRIVEMLKAAGAR